MWRRLSTQLHRFAAANISSPPRSPSSSRPSTILYSRSVASNQAAGSFNHHGMQYSTTVPNDPDIHKDFRSTNKLESSGLSLKDIVEQDVKDNPVMLYMKGVPDLPRCGFNSLSVRVLKEYTTGPHFHKYLSRGSSVEDQTSFSTCTRGLLKFMTGRGRIYLSTSRRNFRGTDMLNNDHMMIMFLAVTSRFAMAIMPFARTATAVTMMSPTMIVTSSMVTSTTATMSVITVTMLMNMMSPAMTVVLVNKTSPAVTVMPSDVTSCTSVMSTGAVVS